MRNNIPPQERREEFRHFVACHLPTEKCVTITNRVASTLPCLASRNHRKIEVRVVEGILLKTVREKFVDAFGGYDVRAAPL